MEATKWENICNATEDFYLEAYKSRSKKQLTQFFKNGQKTSTGTSQNRIYKCNTQMQRYLNFSHQGNAN